MTSYFKFFVGADGRCARSAITVRITADNGVVGWGQSVPITRWSDETPETALTAMRHYYVPALLGRDATDIEGALAALERAIAPGFSAAMPITRAGLEIALHDLAGRLTGRSITQMWGMTAAPTIPLSWTVNVQQLDDAAAVVEEGLRRGYRHFNIKVAPNIDFDLALLKEVRRFVPDVPLWVDANCGYTLEAALDAAPKLADAGVEVLEAPLRPNNIRGYQKLHQQGALPILMDEGVITTTELAEFDGLGMIDGMAMKVPRCGGLASCKAQIEYCLANGLMWLGSGLTEPDIALAAALQVYGAFGLDRPAALNGPQFIAETVLQSPLRIGDGMAHIPTGPGLGIEVDEERLDALMHGRTSAVSSGIQN